MLRRWSQATALVKSLWDRRAGRRLRHPKELRGLARPVHPVTQAKLRKLHKAPGAPARRGRRASSVWHDPRGQRTGDGRADRGSDSMSFASCETHNVLADGKGKAREERLARRSHARPACFTSPDAGVRHRAYHICMGACLSEGHRSSVHPRSA
jgi:hypothetical protein